MNLPSLGCTFLVLSVRVVALFVGLISGIWLLSCTPPLVSFGVPLLGVVLVRLNILFLLSLMFGF